MLGKLNSKYYMKTSNNFTAILNTVILLFYKKDNRSCKTFYEKYFADSLPSEGKGGGP